MSKNKLYFLLLILIAYNSCKEIKNENGNSKTELSEKKTKNEEDIYSIIVSKNKEIVFEEYYNGKTKDSLCDVQSLTKGIMSILIGIAIDKQYIKNEDEPIEKYFPDEYKSLTDVRKKNITIKHLLNQTSGLSWKGYLEHKDWLRSDDPISFVLEKTLDSIPGHKYNYNSGATHLLSVILNKSTGKTTLEFANEFLFKPLNIHSMDWKKRNKGHYDGSGLGLKMKPMDLMKIALLLESEGRHDNIELISKKWIDYLFDIKEKSATNWGLKGSKHGFCWYKSKFMGNSINYGMGYGGQFIIMIPSENLIVVTMHNHDTPDGIEQQIDFLNKRLPQLINTYSKQNNG